MPDKASERFSVFRNDWEYQSALNVDLYNINDIAPMVYNVLIELRARNQVGPVFADVGSGRASITGALEHLGFFRPEDKVIRTDLVADYERRDNSLQIRGNI